MPTTLSSKFSTQSSHEYEKSGCKTLTWLALGLTVILLFCFTTLLTSIRNQHIYGIYWPINSTVLNKPLHLSNGNTAYNIVVVTDLDHDSKSYKEQNTWYSYMKKGVLTLNQDKSSASIHWRDKEIVELKSMISAGGRAMELSDLKNYDGKLYSIDDRTGIIYRIDGHSTYPWVMLSDGPGNQSKGFKGEWISVKNGHLYVGGLGKEWTTVDGEFVNDNPMWIKVISHTGAIKHVDWVDNYKKLRKAAGITYPGYMIHEAAQWSEIHDKWFFLPRRAANEKYSETLDEARGTNYMLIADEAFDKVALRKVGNLTPLRGFSAFQFIPETDDNLIVALKSEEKNGTPVASYITVFSISGQIILDEIPLTGKFKFEGIEFI